ncbi:hypothetical protein [Paenibacillus sp. ISL-20]|uniref:hypothetical protein n=1 Tax=Paenibacillus sp. ISL-20 TaxID=2819163 RepID=UPI001BE66462|nr:hypothetical protein [Paenibacillus sp. ISL-20]MBT2760118.1 hypothetical protein [Paenibacillus sp. ISL-20]
MKGNIFIGFLLVGVLLGSAGIERRPLNYLVRLLSYYLLSTLSLWESLHVARGTLGYFVRNVLLPAGIMNCMNKNQLWDNSRSWFCLGAALGKSSWPEPLLRRLCH